MGTLVTFPPPRPRRAATPSPTSEATILLFMGVRYVRDLDSADSDETAPDAIPDHADACPPLEIA